VAQIASKHHKNHLQLTVACEGGGGVNGVETPYKTSSGSLLHAREVVAVRTTSKKQRRNARQPTSGLLLHVREVEAARRVESSGTGTIVETGGALKSWGSCVLCGVRKWAPHVLTCFRH